MIEITQTSAGAHVQVKDTTTGVVNFFPCRQSTAIYANNTVPNGKIGIRYRDEIFFINVADVTVPAGPWTALTLCQYLNDNFFVDPDAGSSVTTSGFITGNGSFGDPVRLINGTNIGDAIIYLGGGNWISGPITVNTGNVLTGDGTAGNPVRLVNGTNIGDTPYWNGTGWIISQRPADNANLQKNLVVYTFEGGRTGNVFNDTPFSRTAPTVDYVSPGVASRGPIINLAALIVGSQRSDLISNASGNGIVFGNVTNRRIYMRSLINVTAVDGSGDLQVGIFRSTVSQNVNGGMYLQILNGIMRPVWHNGSTNIFGASISYSLNTWYDIELLWKYNGTQVQIEFWRNGVYISTLSHTMGAFTIPDGRITLRNAGAAANPLWNFQTELVAKSIYQV